MYKIRLFPPNGSQNYAQIEIIFLPLNSNRYTSYSTFLNHQFINATQGRRIPNGDVLAPSK